MRSNGEPGQGGPILVYDGDCGFCTQSVRVIERWIPTKARIVPWQFADLAAMGTTPQQAQGEVLWVAEDGRVHGGAQAVAQLLVDAGGVWAALGTAIRIPPIRWIAHLVYRVIAANRYRLPGGTPACALPAEQRPGADSQADRDDRPGS
jgi:alpha-1,6-mannosyltransferase